MMLCSNCSGLLYLCFTEGISKQDYDRLQASASEVKNRLEDSDRKLRILEKSMDAVEKQLKAANVELAALKVACHESVEKEATFQKELNKATAGSAILDSDVLGNHHYDL